MFNTAAMSKHSLYPVYAPSDPIFYMELRRCGNTTRLVDYCIQALFTYGSIRVESTNLSYPNELKHIKNLLETRLATEHTLTKYVSQIDSKTNTLMVEICFFSRERYFVEGSKPDVVEIHPTDSIVEAYKKVCKIAGVPQEIIDNPLLLSSREPNNEEIQWAKQQVDNDPNLK